MMDINQIIQTALPVVYIIVGVALVWFVFELIATVRTTRKTVTSLKSEIEPTLAHVESITAKIDPLVAKVDPLVDRVSLTVDAANLEVMRVDQILENVTDITNSLSSTVDAVDNVTNAPLRLVNNASSKVLNAFKAKKASSESAALGAGSQAEDLAREVRAQSRATAQTQGAEASSEQSAPAQDACTAHEDIHTADTQVINQLLGDLEELDLEDAKTAQKQALQEDVPSIVDDVDAAEEATEAAEIAEEAPQEAPTWQKEPFNKGYFTYSTK